MRWCVCVCARVCLLLRAKRNAKKKGFEKVLCKSRQQVSDHGRQDHKCRKCAQLDFEWRMAFSANCGSPRNQEFIVDVLVSLAALL